jgi:hypothetical protein
MDMVEDRKSQKLRLGGRKGQRLIDSEVSVFGAEEGERQRCSSWRGSELKSVKGIEHGILKGEVSLYH